VITEKFSEAEVGVYLLFGFACTRLLILAPPHSCRKCNIHWHLLH